MKNIILLTLFFFSLCISNSFISQTSDFKNVELLYSQKHYKMVYRRANRMLDKPDYDFSLTPSFYKSLSIFQLSQNTHWLKKHPLLLEEAREIYLKVQNSNEGLQLIKTHLTELMYLKSDLQIWLDELKNNEKTDLYNSSALTLKGLFDKIPNIDKESEIKNSKQNKIEPGPITSKKRKEIIEFAKKQIGICYAPSGIDCKGFDCSGFTCYVMNEFGVILPRRAADQEKNSKIIPQKNAKTADLIFFDNGSGISHVGIIISNTKESLQMIHSSSSKGIIITEINKSEYWKTRIHSFGSYLED